ncbi:DUF3310 domain-containing protein [Mycolicibacterium sp.]|uniref:DUF3310 domain-containing protein n=1 Tax=Mycolicibacterium sp. TaxID=2320850 RepID=UPI00355D7745
MPQATAPRSAAALPHDPVHSPSHYTSHPSGIECLEITRQLSFGVGNTVKYVWGRGDKGKPAQDLDKSMFFLLDARKNVPQSLLVPAHAQALLRRAAAADPDPLAAAFYRAVADMRWDAVEDGVRQLREALPSGTE